MQEKVKGLLSTAKEKWSALGKATRTLLISLVVIVVLAVVGVTIYQSTRPYAVLFTELNQEDMSDIIAYLTDQGLTDYKIENQDTILVPEDMEQQLKASLIGADYPSSGYSLYFDNISSLTTEGEREQLIKYQLEESIAGVIRSMEGVKDATVLIEMGENNSYILSTSNTLDASVSIQITMKDGETLSQTMADGIRTFVEGQKGVEFDNVKIIDSYGNTYSSDVNDTDQTVDLSALKQQLEEQTDNKVRTQILQILIPLFGEENVKVGVNSTVSVDKSYSDSTDYSLEEWSQGKDDTIIGEIVYDQVISMSDDTAGGVAGSESNADVGDVGQYVEGEDEEGGQLLQNSGSESHLVDNEQTQTERIAGRVTDVMVSVTINQSVAGNADTEQLIAHVARAAGIGEEVQDEKISVLVGTFYNDPTQQPGTDPIDGLVLEPWMIYVAIGGGVLFLLILVVIILLIRRARKKKRLRQLEEEAMARAAAEAAAVIEAAPKPTEGADVMQMEDTEKSMELRKDVRRFAETNPEIAAQMIKNWLKGGDGDA